MIAQAVPPVRYASTLVSSQNPGQKPVTVYSIRGVDTLLEEEEHRQKQLESVLSSTVLIGNPTGELASRIIEIRNDEDEDAPPTEYAIGQTLKITEDAAVLLSRQWRVPRVATDGYGGLRLSWKAGKREIRAVISHDRSKGRYLYWEDESSYGSVANFTAVTLYSYLDKLVGNRAFR